MLSIKLNIILFWQLHCFHRKLIFTFNRRIAKIFERDVQIMTSAKNTFRWHTWIILTWFPSKRASEEFAKYVELLRNLHLDLRETSLKVILSLGQNFGQARRQIWNILLFKELAAPMVDTWCPADILWLWRAQIFVTCSLCNTVLLLLWSVTIVTAPGEHLSWP